MGPFEAVRRWQDYLVATGASESTRRQYRYHLIHFLADTLTDLGSITEDDVVSYLAQLPAKGHMRGQMLRALKSYYAWAEGRELALNPTRRLRIRPPKYGPAPSLSEEELRRLLEAARRRDPRRAWAIQFAYATGARLGSLCAVKPEDVRDGHVVFRVAKGERPYAVPLGALGREAADALLAYGSPTLIGVGPGAFWHWVHQASVESGVRAWPHLLRHTFATRLLQSGVDVRTVQELLNHSDLSQIPRYTAVTDERKRAAVGLL